MTKETRTGDTRGETRPRRNRGLLAAIAVAAFIWFFVGVMIDPRSGFWVMPTGVAVMALSLGVLLPSDRWRFVRVVCLGLVGGLGLDLLVRGIPVFLASHRWDWLSAVFISTAIACLAAIIGGACSMLVRTIFWPRAV